MSELDQLIKGCVNKDRKSQNLLYRMYCKKMYGLCLRYAKNREEAEDFLQEGFIKVFTKIENYKFQGSFEGWMRRIIINTILEKFRQNHYLYAIANIDDVSETIACDAGFEQMAADDLLNIMQKLSPGYKMVFNLYAIEGYSHKEIADMLGISEGTSKSQLSRARIMFREMIKKISDQEISISKYGQTS
jgi:RNA polymerase sigma-70 factor (ECF subfamily)